VTADLTLVNLNMLLIRYVDAMERELHVPLGPLYLTASLERAGFRVDFRDYQVCDAAEPFLPEALADFCRDPAPVIGLSCMANLLPFTILAARELKTRFPDRTIVLGGVGPKAVETALLERFPWIDMVAHGEGERSSVDMMRALRDGTPLDDVPGVAFRRNGVVVMNPPAPRIEDLSEIGLPALDRLDYRLYAGHNMITSRGCPYLCTFCSVAPVWGHAPAFRDPADIVAEMAMLHREQGVTLFLFQDEFFVSSKERVLAFCDALRRERLGVKWKAFARVNLADDATMDAMAGAGCVEIRFGIECGSNRMLERVKKGFTIEQAMDVVSRAVLRFPRVDTFFVWGFPFETMDDFHQTLFQMIAFRLIGSRILPSLLSLLPQTEIYREVRAAGTPLEFYPGLLPEYMLTGHEVCDDGHLSASPRHAFIFDFIRANPDLFPGFFLVDVKGNILPKFELLRQHGFYASREREVSQTDSCGAHSPRMDNEQVLGALTR
jgi:radical SAM superfamily enzyme YgiQ (UPF0313 family)